MAQEFRVKALENHCSVLVKLFYVDALLLILDLLLYVSFTWCFLQSSRRLTCLREAKMFYWVRLFCVVTLVY